MKQTKAINGTIDNIARYDHSANGNPRFTFTVNGLTFFTGVDSMHGYAIQNYKDGDKVKIEYKTLYNKDTITTIELIS